jgi:phytoene desaturase
MLRRKAVVIGAGIGGIACAMRLQSLGFDTQILEALDAPGGRAYVRKADGFTFDMGPTVLTVPHFIEELFSLQQDHAMLGEPDFPPHVLDENVRVREGVSGGPNTSKYVEIIPILPFYRIYFDDGTFFDYDGDPVSTREQIKQLAPEDLAGYEAFHDQARAIFQRGFLNLGYTYFGSLGSMLRVVPDLLKLGAVRSLFGLVSKYFKSDKMRQVFSFEPLLVGGNPMKVPAIYAMIHFVEKTWGIHYAKGGTGALVAALVKKFEEMGGQLRVNAPVQRILVENGVAKGVELASGEKILADVVVSNADYATTYLKLVDKAHRRINRDALVKFRKQSMSLVVIYFGYECRDNDPDLRHHNIILGPRYEALLDEIFEKKVMSPDFSQYLHIPTLTDPLYPRSCGAVEAYEFHHAGLFFRNFGFLSWQWVWRGACFNADSLFPPAQQVGRRAQSLSGRPRHAARWWYAVGNDVGKDDRTRNCPRPGRGCIRRKRRASSAGNRIIRTAYRA